MSREAKPLVNLKAVIDFWVVDEAFPANCCTWLLKIASHNNDEIILVFLFQFHEAVAVFEGCRWVVDGARADDNEEAMIGVCVLHAGDALFAALEDSFLGGCGLCDFML